MKTIIVVLLSTLLLCIEVFAAEKAPGEKSGSAQASKTSAQDDDDEDADCELVGTHAGSVCLDKRVRRLDEELNIAYQNALKKRPAKPQEDERHGQEQLRKSQRAWLKYMDEDCSLVGGLEAASSTPITFNSLACRERMLRQRIDFLVRIASIQW